MTWRALLDDPPAAPGDPTLKIAIVTAISVVLAAAVTGIFSVLSNRRRNDDNPPGYPTVQQVADQFRDDLIKRAEQAEKHVTDLQTRLDQRLQRIDDLERFCYTSGVDPDTGQPFHPAV